MTYTLVYQGGIANVFRHSAIADVRERCLQADFAACENFCRGLREAGQQVFVAWCNEAGDIATRSWRYDSFNEAPFCGVFSFQAPPNQSEWAKVLAKS